MTCWVSILYGTVDNCKMDTQFDDIALFFLSGVTFKYKTGFYKPAVFDNKLPRQDLEILLEEIYLKTKNFESLQAKLKFNKRWSIANVFMIITMLFLLITAFQNFKKVWLIIFLVMATICICSYAMLVYQETRIDNDIDTYESTICELLTAKNGQLREAGLKFVVMKEYVIIALQAEYKLATAKVKLVNGSRDLQPFFTFNKMGLAPNNRAADQMPGAGVVSQSSMARRARDALGRSVLGSNRDNAGLELRQTQGIGAEAGQAGDGEQGALQSRVVDMKFKGMLKYTQIYESETI